MFYTCGPNEAMVVSGTLRYLFDFCLPLSGHDHSQTEEHITC